jgi:hypothetical protein
MQDIQQLPQCIRSTRPPRITLPFSLPVIRRQQLDRLPQLVVRRVELRVRALQTPVLLGERRELRFQVFGVLFFALAEGALRGAILGAAALRTVSFVVIWE